jgi:shikimate 5-dehydrogenase
MPNDNDERPAQQQPMPGYTDRMQPRSGSWRRQLRRPRPTEGKKTVITGADSGIGRAVAIAYAREGADVLISYLNEDEDAEETARLVRRGGAQGRACPGRSARSRRIAAR